MSDAPAPGPFSGDQPPSEEPPGAPLPGASKWRPEGYGYAVNPNAKTNNLAIGALVCGVVGLLLVPIVGAVGIYLGFRAKGQIERSEGAQKGRGLAIAGIVTGILAVLVAVIFLSSGAVTR